MLSKIISQGKEVVEGLRSSDEQALSLMAKSHATVSELLEKVFDSSNNLDSHNVSIESSNFVILKRGITAILLMFVLTLISTLINSALGVAMMCLTAAVLLIFTFAYGAEEQNPLFPPRIVLYAILLSVSLAVLVAVSLFV